MPSRCWRGQPRFYGAIYAYYRYHSLVSTSEVAWERSGLLRHRRLLRVGNERWPGEYYAGYPTRVIMGNMHARLTAYGTTAAQRRASRVELWQRLGEFTFGTLDPAVEGKAMCVLATSVTASETYLRESPLPAFVGRLRKHPRIDAEAIAQFTAGWPAGQNHPEPWLPWKGPAAKSDAGGPNTPGKTADDGGAAPLRHGVCLRLRLPYPKARIQTLRLNGREPRESETDGFLQWTARGSTYVQVAIPPERLVADDLFVVTCDYDPGERRERWDYRRFVNDE
jgi:hypothetical protein